MWSIRTAGCDLPQAPGSAGAASGVRLTRQAVRAVEAAGPLHRKGLKNVPMDLQGLPWARRGRQEAILA